MSTAPASPTQSQSSVPPQPATAPTDPLIFDIETHRELEPKFTAWLDAEIVKFSKTKGVLRFKGSKEDKIAEKREELQDKAALSAISGRILAIGYANATTKKSSIDCVSEGASVPTKLRQESDLLNGFWSKFAAGRTMIGFNIKKFDLPFIVRRSLIAGVDIPDGAFDGRYFSRQFVDLMDYWTCGIYGEYESLDAICRAIGCGAKPDDVEGATFGTFFLAGGTNRSLALSYALNDVAMTLELASRMGVA